MVGCFGLRDDNHPSHFPGNLVVEGNPLIDVFWLNRIGALVENVETPVKLAGKTYQLTRQTPDIWVGETRISVTWDEPMRGVGRPWFECPACGQRCRHVYLRDV